MIIKVWNNHDCEEKKKRLLKNLMEFAGIEYIHNLEKGWENKLLMNGSVLTNIGDELKTKKEIKEEINRIGCIQFFHKKKNYSLAFIKKIRKSAHLCWS